MTPNERKAMFPLAISYPGPEPEIVVCLQYKGTNSRTLPITLLDETDTHFVVRFELKGKAIDGARYSKAKWEVVRG
jgi:hypothetical protein